jgi:hypothetical protein
VDELARRVAEIRRVSLQPDFIQVRAQAEAEARDLLNEKSGRFIEEDFARFLDLCNTEVVPLGPNSTELRTNPSRTRFRQSFSGPNRKPMIEKLDECNRWIGALWQSTDHVLNILDQFWRENNVKGAGTGLPTMIMYLKDPEVYNIWLVTLADILGSVLGRTFRKKKCSDSYISFNDDLNEHLRYRFRLKPQEIDFILIKLGQ